MSLTARWIMSVEIVLYQEAPAFRMCNEGVILALVPLLFWAEFIRVQNFSVSSCKRLLSSRSFDSERKQEFMFLTRHYEREALFTQASHHLNVFAVFSSLLRLVFVCRSDRGGPWVGGEESQVGVLPDSREQQQACRTPLQTARWLSRSASTALTPHTGYC